MEEKEFGSIFDRDLGQTAEQKTEAEVTEAREAADAEIREAAENTAAETDAARAAEIADAAAAKAAEQPETPAEPADLDATQPLDEAGSAEEVTVHNTDFEENGFVQAEETVDSSFTEAEESVGSGFSEVNSETGNGFNDSQDSGSYDAGQTYRYAAPEAGRAAYYQTKKPGYVTKRFFVIFLIIAMLLTMLASVGITTAYTTYLNNKESGSGHATNYTLTTSDESLSYKSIIEKTQDSVVSITTESVATDMWMQNYVTQGAGSGVIIQSDGYIITCEHVIEGARKIKVTLRNGKEYDAEVIGADVSNDIAVIKVDAKNLQEATYGDSSKLEVGDQVVAIGNPLGTLSGTATTGIISALNRNLTVDNRTLNLFQTDASINPGNSGGGMFDTSGNLIGIVEAKSTGSDIDGLGFATPINKAAKIAKKIIETGGNVNSGDSSDLSKSTPIIGIMVSPVDNQTAMQFGYKYGGLLIKQVTSDEAKAAGLQAGDIIYEAEGTTISDNDQLSSILSKKKVGDKVKLGIARDNGETVKITTTLTSSDTSH